MRPFAFIFKRTAELVLLAFLVTFITFWLSAIIPGDFFSAHVADSPIRTESVAQLRRQYWLDQPFHIQYLHWLGNLIRLDFGYSLFYQRPVSSVVADALVKTLWIGIPAFILGFAGGVLLGTIHGLAGERGIGKLLSFVMTIALSLPTLLLGLAALLFALGHLPGTSAVAPLTALLVTRALVLNALVGMTCGYLFWRRGLEAAMFVHMGFHLVWQLPGAWIARALMLP